MKKSLQKRPIALMALVVPLGMLLLCGRAHAASLERNWALTGSARQSSTHLGGDAQRAIDGTRDGNWLANSVTHTIEEDEPYWEIDLGASYRVDEVRVFGRSDCCQERLSSFFVFYLDSNDGFRSRGIGDTMVQAMVLPYPVFFAQGVTDPVSGVLQPGHRVVLGGARARFIRVQIPGRAILSLAEVEVIARYDIAGPPDVADAVQWKKTPVSVGAGATLTSNGGQLVLLSTGANQRLHASIDFQPAALVSGSPRLQDLPPGAAWDPDSARLFVAGVDVRRRNVSKVWVLETEVRGAGLVNPAWQVLGAGDGPPAVAVGCRKAVVAWRRGQNLISTWRPLAPGATWAPPQEVAMSLSAPSLAVNASGDVGLAYLTPGQRIAFRKSRCADPGLAWLAYSPPAGRFHGGKVGAAAYGDLFSLAAVGEDGRAHYATQRPVRRRPWTAFESVDVSGPPLAESPTLFVFGGLTLALTRAVDGTMRYWVRTPNSVAPKDGWIGGQLIANGGTGALPPMVAEVGRSRISGVSGAPSELFMASRGVEDHAIYAINLSRFVARELITHVFGLRIGGNDLALARAQWGDIASLTNLYEHLVALLALPRPAWVAIASKPCGGLAQPTQIVIEPGAFGSAQPGECPMRAWLDATRTGAVASPTGGLMHEWMHIDFVQRGIGSLSGYGEAFEFDRAASNPGESGLRPCRQTQRCGGDPCERAGDDHGTGLSSTTDFAASEIELRRWDDVRVCVSAVDGPAGRRYQGGFAWYDLGTPDHAFIHTAVWYRWYGDQLREMAAADSARGNTQLQQRYDWVRDNYFDGVEYNGRPSGTLPRTNRSMGYFGMPNR